MQQGAFLVRESTRSVGDHVLSLIHNGELQHYIVSVCPGIF